MFSSLTTPPLAASTASTLAVPTCAFISGDPSLPLACDKGQKCTVDTSRQLLACCWDVADRPCSVSTRCLDRTQSALEDVIDKLDMVCSDERAPYCKTNVVHGRSQPTGYSLFVCDTDKSTQTVFRHTTTGRSLTLYTPSSAAPTSAPSSSSSQPGYYSRQSQSGLSSSAISGIAVGSAGALVLLSVIMWAMWWRKPKEKPAPVERQAMSTSCLGQLKPAGRQLSELPAA